MNTSRLSAGASRFAHLAGLTRGKRGSRAEESERDDARAEDDDEDEHAEEDDTSGDDEPKSKKGRKARADEDDGDDEPKGKRGSRASDDDEEDEPKGRRSRRAAEDDGDDAEDDDDKEEMNGRSAKASARRREQARIAHILGHSAAAANLPLAVSLACETRMTRHEAVAVLKGQADREPARQDRRVSREDRNSQLGGNGGSEKPKPGASWGRSFAAINVTPRT